MAVGLVKVPGMDAAVIIADVVTIGILYAAFMIGCASIVLQGGFVLAVAFPMTLINKNHQVQKEEVCHRGGIQMKVQRLFFKIDTMKRPIIFKKLTHDRFILLGSIATWAYFTALVAFSLYDIDVIFLVVLIELLTVPFILLLLWLTFLSVKNNIKTGFNIKSNHFISLLLSGVTIVMLAIATIYD